MIQASLASHRSKRDRPRFARRATSAPVGYLTSITAQQRIRSVQLGHTVEQTVAPSAHHARQARCAPPKVAGRVRRAQLARRQWRARWNATAAPLGGMTQMGFEVLVYRAAFFSMHTARRIQQVVRNVLPNRTAPLARFAIAPGCATCAKTCWALGQAFLNDVTSWVGTVVVLRRSTSARLTLTVQSARFVAGTSCRVGPRLQLAVFGY
jgi:hypothetical protein